MWSMDFLPSLLIGALPAAASAFIGGRLARRCAAPASTSEVSAANGWLQEQTRHRSIVGIAAGLAALLVVLIVFVGLVAAIWPFMEKWLFWLTAAVSLAGYALSFCVRNTLAALPDELGQRGRLLSWGGLAAWTLALLSLALGAYQDLYAHSLFDGMLDDLAARSMISVGAACALYAVTIVTGFQLTGLLVWVQASEHQSLNGLVRLAWQLTIYGSAMVAITGVAGFTLASGLLL
jgi:hypothetical protein